MTLETLLQGLRYQQLAGPALASVEVKRVSADSRQVDAETLFVAVRGRDRDGHSYVEDALARGAAAVLVETPVALEGQHCLLKLADTRRALGQVAARLAGEPSGKLRLVGVTGTNGKTTVTTVLASIANAAGVRSGRIGTVGIWIGDEALPATHTTPDAAALQPLLARMVEAGCGLVFLEVSSHALEQARVEGCRFPVAVFTGLSRDHLDYHKTLEAYFESKRTLFFEYLDPEGNSVVQVGEAYGQRLYDELERAGRKVTACTLAQSSLSKGVGERLVPEAVTLGLDGLKATLTLQSGETLGLQSPMVGAHNLENVLSAVGAALALGLSSDAIVAGCAACEGPPGRLQRIPDAEGGRYLFVDYAHTDDALRRVLASLRAAAPKGAKLLVVFGCGGDRDRGKRPLMAAAVAEADGVVVTSDNPRREDPEAIIAEILPGIRQSQPHAVDPDRRAAIELAVGVARPGDVVLVAGKGHERFQTVGEEKRPFDDCLVVAEALGRVAPGTRQLA